MWSCVRGSLRNSRRLATRECVPCRRSSSSSATCQMGVELLPPNQFPQSSRHRLNCAVPVRRSIRPSSGWRRKSYLPSVNTPPVFSLKITPPLSPLPQYSQWSSPYFNPLTRCCGLPSVMPENKTCRSSARPSPSVSRAKKISGGQQTIAPSRHGKTLLGYSS